MSCADGPTRADVVYGSDWTWLGDTVQMQYDLAHFTGYRFALFNYATAEPGGYVDVDWFRVSDATGLANPTHRQSERALHD